MVLVQYPERSGFPSAVRGAVHVFPGAADALFAGGLVLEADVWAEISAGVSKTAAEKTARAGNLKFMVRVLSHLTEDCEGLRNRKPFASYMLTPSIAESNRPAFEYRAPVGVCEHGLSYSQKFSFKAACITRGEYAALMMPALALPAATTVVVPRLKLVWLVALNISHRNCSPTFSVIGNLRNMPMSSVKRRGPTIV